MAVKVARESFSKEEIIDILKRNVTLYKGERDFVDYIVNLAMFLIEQQLPLEGDADSIQQEYGSLDADSLSGLTPMPVTGFLPMSGHEQPHAPPGGYQTPRPSAEYDHIPQGGNAAGQYDPGQHSGSHQLPPQSPIPGVSPRPNALPIGTPVAGIPISPPHGISGNTPFPGAGQTPLPNSGYSQPTPPAYVPNQGTTHVPVRPAGGYQQVPAQAQLENPKTPMSSGPRYSAPPSRFDVESSPLNTPTSDTNSRYPGGMPTPRLPQQPPPSPNAQPPRPGLQQGLPPDPLNSKTKVYKVFRSYSSSGGQADNTVYCPICGTEASGVRKCPNCGHLI
jgi:hypothetical protein